MQRMNSSFRHARSEYQRATVLGFTLVELMITIAVLGIVMAIAVPSFQNMMARSRLTSAANEIIATVQEARMEAIRRRRNVVICPTTDGALCGGANWSRLISYVELGADNQAGATGETVIRNTVLKNQTLNLATSASLGTARLWFSSDGLLSVGAVAAPARSAAIRICSPKLSSENARDISMHTSRVAVVPAHSAACAAPANP